MPHVVRELDWGTIDIVVHEGRVFFQQRWKYDWQVKPPLEHWALEEKRAFHRAVDRQIWGSWSNRVTFSVTGTSAFAREFRGVSLPINVDVRWVLGRPHWNVTAVKLPEGEMPHNWVNWGTRTIKLHTSKLKSYEACNLDTPAVCKPGFRSVPHEFGHAMGRDDEYVRDSPYLPDADSILNVGRELRRRHFDTLIGEMNKMIPSTTFVVHHID